MQNSKQPYRVLLSFDLEEFDIPNEYGATLSTEEQLDVTRRGMNALLPVLNQLQVPVTFFTTAFYAQQNDALIKTLAATHEIASHTFYHSKFTDEDIITPVTAQRTRANGGRILEIACNKAIAAGIRNDVRPVVIPRTTYLFHPGQVP